MQEYGVFKGIPQLKPFQLGLVSDLTRAIDLMNRMNQRIPGDYFIRNMVTHELMVSVHAEPDSAAA